jgi:hypothetical protein
VVFSCLVILLGAQARAEGLPCSKEHPTFCGLFESSQEQALEANNAALVELTLNDTLDIILDRRAKELNAKEACFKSERNHTANAACKHMVAKYQSDFAQMRQELALSLAERNFIPDNGKVGYGRALSGADQKFDVHVSIHHSVPGTGTLVPLTAQESASAWQTFSSEYEQRFHKYEPWAAKNLPLSLEGKAEDWAHHPQALHDAINHGFSLRWDDELHDIISEHHAQYVALIAANPEFLIADQKHPDPEQAVETSLGYLAKYRAHLLKSLKDNPDLMVGFEPLLLRIAKTSPQCAGTIARLLKTAKTKETVANLSLAVVGVGDVVTCALAPEAFLPCAGVIGMAVGGVGVAESSQAYDTAVTNVLTGLAQKDYSNTTPDDISKTQIEVDASIAAVGISAIPVVSRTVGAIGRIAQRDRTIAEAAAGAKRPEAPHTSTPREPEAEAIPEAHAHAPAVKLPLSQNAQLTAQRVSRQLAQLQLKSDFKNFRAAEKAIAEIQDPELRNAFKKANLILRDPRAIADYFTKLTEETFQNMMNSKNQRWIKMAEEGLLDKKAILEVLYQRARDRGETVFTKLTSFNTDDDFFEAVGKGPIIDSFNSGNDHGAYVHLLQRDIVAPALDQSVSGGAARVNTFLSQEGRAVWTEVFDSPVGEVGNNPEFLNRQILRAARIPL